MFIFKIWEFYQNATTLDFYLIRPVWNSVNLFIITLFIIYLFWPCHTAYGILVPTPEIEPEPPEMDGWSGGVCTSLWIFQKIVELYFNRMNLSFCGLLAKIECQYLFLVNVPGWTVVEGWRAETSGNCMCLGWVAGNPVCVRSQPMTQDTTVTTASMQPLTMQPGDLLQLPESAADSLSWKFLRLPSASWFFLLDSILFHSYQDWSLRCWDRGEVLAFSSMGKTGEGSGQELESCVLALLSFSGLLGMYLKESLLTVRI